LKSFAQTETYVNDYWSTKVAVWFPKHEIKAMAGAFADFESIHAEAYARLNEELGLDDFEAFMEDEEAKAKIDRLVELPGDTLREKALSLAIFSAFTEGVNLFSSFAILMSFQLRNLMKGTGQVVEWSVRDESLHSKAGCWLFRTMMEEMPELNEGMEKQIYDACDISVKLESPTRILISGIDKEKVGFLASKIRDIRPPEPYKGKGILYDGEKIVRKAGKTGK
jgi:ribonucleoside-diphosphate reductase beta chain